MKTKLLGVSVILFATLSSAFAQKIDVFSAATIVEKIKNRISKVDTFSGSFTYIYNGKTYWGVMKYKSPNRFRMDYQTKDSSGKIVASGQKMIANDQHLWIVYGGNNIAVKEVLDQNPKVPVTGWNIKRLLREYQPTLPKDGYKVQYGDEKNFKIAYRLLFQPKSNVSGFRSIEMIVDADGLILKVKAVNQIGKSIELDITYHNFNQPIANGTFWYEADANTQVYENVLTPGGSK